jgi:pyruvate formate lyase activating enzyme
MKAITMCYDGSDPTMLEAMCSVCGKSSQNISTAIGACLACIRKNPDASKELLAKRHQKSRAEFHLPLKVPRSDDGLICHLCSNRCQLAEGERGYCGLRVNRNGKLLQIAGTTQRGLLHWYRDPLPTNCVADWVCPGHRELGKHNLAIFYASCTLNCLFCQNWHYRQTDPRYNRQGHTIAISAKDLAACANTRTFCACFFGGDPGSQMPHALATAKKLVEEGVRVCWETAGTMHPKLLLRALELSISSGGCLKFDLKACDPNLHFALTGSTNDRILENIRTAIRHVSGVYESPPIVISTPLISGYIDEDEIGQIASFIAELNPDVPYSLLGFQPAFEMFDLPHTSSRFAKRAKRRAIAAGLNRVHLGNTHIFSMARL